MLRGQSVVGAGVDVLKQVNGRGLLNGGDLPVAAEVGAVLEVAQSLHHHQASLSSGNSIIGTVCSRVVAGNDAVRLAGSYVLGSPLGHVGEAGLGSSVVVIVQIQQVSHNGCHLGTSNGLVRIKVPVFVTDHDRDSPHDFDGFLVMSGSDIGVARSAGTHDQHTKNHGRGQEQAESTLQVSHWNSSFFIQEGVFSPKYWPKIELFCQNRKA